MSQTRNSRTRALEELFSQRVVLIDGAIGTYIQSMNPTALDFGGTSAEGCTEAILLARPDLIEKIHADYLEAGADIIETNTFGATPIVLKEYGLETMSREICRLGAVTARRAAERFSEKGRIRFVAGSVGPTTCALSIDKKLSFRELAMEHYFPCISGLFEGGADYFLIETCQDTLNLKAALFAIEELFRRGAEPIPVAVSATLDSAGRMLAGMSSESLARTLEPFNLLYIGLNCGEGPRFLGKHVRRMAEIYGGRIALMPNAGLPDSDGSYDLNPEQFAQEILESCGVRTLNLVGGCCGTTPDHIKALAGILPMIQPKNGCASSDSAAEAGCTGRGNISFLTGADVLEIRGGGVPVIAGERSNALGSKKFREYIQSNDFDGAAEFARRQLDEGAALLDVAVQQTDRDETSDMVGLLQKLVSRIRAPVMVDTTNPDVAMAALECVQGKAIVNSANLEGGEDKFVRMIRTARSMGAALAVGLIDEKGMAVSLERKSEIARRAMGILEREGMLRSDVYLDALVFPCASGDPRYLGAASETILAIRKLKEDFPGVRTLLGISNVSFGLPPGIRPLTTRLFFDACAEAGLDLAIANAAGLEKTKQQLASGNISTEMIEAAEALLKIRPAEKSEAAGKSEEEVRCTALENWKNAIARAADLGRAVQQAQAASTAVVRPAENVSPEEHIFKCIVQGKRDGLSEALELCLAGGMTAQEILDGVLMRGMDEVGRLFGEGSLIVPEVLSSAEVMRSAVAVLAPRLSGGTEKAARGRFLIATVKGDVHDIGKNLVSMVFSSNGYEVVDLGTKVEDDVIVRTAQQIHPNLIGLSGLLVRSAFQMVETVRALDEAGIYTPVLVGGAALSKTFTEKRIAPATRAQVIYTKDAMACLAAAKSIGDSSEASEADKQISPKNTSSCLASPDADSYDCRKAHSRPEAPEEESSPSIDVSPRSASDVSDAARKLGVIHSRLPADVLRKLINPAMLYGHHLGLKGAFLDKLDTLSADEILKLDPRAKFLRDDVDRALQLLSENRIIPQSVRRSISAFRSGSNTVSAGENSEQIQLEFPRIGGRCLADLVPEAGGTIGVFVSTCGVGAAPLVQKLISGGELRLAHVLQALTLSLAEAAAEWTHALLRNDWNTAELPDPEALTPQFRNSWIRGEYPGMRASPGYRLCPDMELQRKIFALLRPEDMGVSLTETCMMDPEASVSAIVFP